MKIYPSKVEKVLGTRLMDDGTYTIELGIQKGDATRLSMTPQLGHEIMDCLAALNDEAMAKNAPEIWGAKAAAYRNVKTFETKRDLPKTVLLIEFDPHEPHRVGVAIPIGFAPVLIQKIQAVIDEAT